LQISEKALRENRLAPEEISYENACEMLRAIGIGVPAKKKSAFLEAPRAFYYLRELRRENLTKAGGLGRNFFAKGQKLRKKRRSNANNVERRKEPTGAKNGSISG
jgi:hypothetical protein